MTTGREIGADGMATGRETGIDGMTAGRATGPIAGRAGMWTGAGRAGMWPRPWAAAVAAATSTAPPIDSQRGMIMVAFLLAPGVGLRPTGCLFVGGSDRRWSAEG
jgi:hypothetical protein